MPCDNLEGWGEREEELRRKGMQVRLWPIPVDKEQTPSPH